MRPSLSVLRPFIVRIETIIVSIEAIYQHVSIEAIIVSNEAIIVINEAIIVSIEAIIVSIEAIIISSEAIIVSSEAIIVNTETIISRIILQHEAKLGEFKRCSVNFGKIPVMRKRLQEPISGLFWDSGSKISRLAIYFFSKLKEGRSSSSMISNNALFRSLKSYEEYSSRRPMAALTVLYAKSTSAFPHFLQ
ncbi:hypothetical protein Btru_065181 [Bulinus truncatus]|nr:hypothetical protein Btru_065181 [Bulinus truncatus]